MPALLLLAGCAVLGQPRTSYPLPVEVVEQMVQVDGLEEAALAWGGPSLPVAPLRGARLLYDSRVPAKPALAVTRSVLRSNQWLNRFDALVFATQAIADARAEGLDYGFFCAVLLQESAFNPRAMSSAGAIGIAQFTIDTAQAYGVDPFDWRDAMRGSASLLGSYLRDYEGQYEDPYAATLAAYNAGPVAVSHYHGVPPYRETRDYIALVYDRWSRIVRDVTGVVIPRS